MSTAQLIDVLKAASIETIQMVVPSTIFAIIGGLILGLVLYITANPLLHPNKYINALSGFVINIIRSIPFLILLVLLMPLTDKLVGTRIGAKAAVVPLTVASIAFFARLIEAAFAEVDKGIIEATLAMGAGIKEIILDVLLVEALPAIVRAITVTLISVIGFSAMAGVIGAGGIGDLAIRFGYYRYQTGVMFITVALLVVVVQVIQVIGEKIAILLTKK